SRQRQRGGSAVAGGDRPGQDAGGGVGGPRRHAQYPHGHRQVRLLGPHHDHREHSLRGEPPHGPHHRLERARRPAPADFAAGGGELTRVAPFPATSPIATALASATSQSTKACTWGRVPVICERTT